MKKERAADDTRGELAWCEHEATARQDAVRDALIVTVDFSNPPGLTHGCFVCYTRPGASTC